MPSALRRHWRAASALVLIAVLLGGLGAWWSQRVRPVTWDVRGFNMPAWSVDGFDNSAPALGQLRAAGGNTVTLVVTWYTPHADSAEIRRTDATPSDQSLIGAIGAAREAGLRVIVKPMVDVDDRSWRATINPTDADAWFANYRAMMDHYADIAAAHDAWGLVVGNELVSMSTNPAYEQRWRDVIAGVRERFAGKLTYGANWGGNDAIEEWTHVPFWDALDYVGIAAYFELSDDAEPDVATLRRRWTEWRTKEIAPFQQRVGKPILFTEIGYRSLAGAAGEPWNAARDGALDTAVQAACYQATFEAWRDVPWFAGTLFWNWNPNGAVSPTDNGYEVQNKPALDTLARYYGGDATALHDVTAVKVYHPLSNQKASGAIAIEAFATGALSVTYQVGSSPPVAMARESAEGLWRAPLETSILPDGTYTIAITAHGAKGTATDQAWNVVVGNDAASAPASTAAPTPAAAPTATPAQDLAIRIEHPLSDQAYSGVIPVRADASGAVAVSYRTENGTPIPLAWNAQTQQWDGQLDTTQLPDGRHQVIVTARDSAGALVSDQAWNITVRNNGS